MWYVVQVRTGAEESVRKQYERLFGKTPQEQCFIPYYEQMKRYEGTWHKERSILFPGYVFLISDDLERLKGRLQSVIGFTRLLGMENIVLPLTDEEVRFMEKFDGGDHVAVMSKGIMENTKVIVTEGPLQSWEGQIKRIDRHKRKAWLEVEMFGRMQRIEVGLEILEKREIGE